MSSLYRLKAYFGMVPPEDMDAYADAYGYDPRESEYDSYDSRDSRDARDYDERSASRAARDVRRGADRADGLELRGGPDGWSGDYAEQVPDQRQPRNTGTSRPRHDSRPGSEPAPVSAGGSSRSGNRSPQVHGALAVDTMSAGLRAPSASLEPLSSLASSPAGATGGSLPLSRITTVHPRSYNEARTIGERYREGIPVIINLTELDDAAAKRLVDFAAGLAFALRGSIDKVTSRVFLLSPAGVDVSAEERRKLAERGFFGQD